jgi:hypothetical protein
MSEQPDAKVEIFQEVSLHTRRFPHIIKDTKAKLIVALLKDMHDAFLNEWTQLMNMLPEVH